ncbi:MAG: sulfatase family protein [bacterium]
MSKDRRPNILWYCTDQQRSDTIRSLGNRYINTPTLDRLVESGVAFTRAYTQSPICTPSRATFLTGRYPSTHHVHRNGNDFFPPSEVLVTKLLAEAGYDCGFVGKLHLSRSKGRIERRPDDGYRIFHWSHHPYPDWPEGHDYADWLRNEKGVDPHELYGKLKKFYGPGVPAEYHQTTWCSEMAIRFITEKREGPWLISINPFDPHPPFDPPPEYLDRYNPSEIPPPLFREEDIERQKAFRGIDQQSVDAVNPLVSPQGDDEISAGMSLEEMASMPPKSFDGRMVKACYYAMIELIDDQLGRIIDVLKDTDQLDNTIIIFMSDHGELLGDHGLLYKGCRFFESLVHVPLIVSWPERFRKGLRSDALVELVDLAPTLLDAVGLEVPYYMQGKSLFPILTGEANPNHHKPHVICEYNDAVDLPNATHGSMYFDGRYKIAVYHGHSIGEIYDLEDDPGEFENLWNDPECKDLKVELLMKHFDAMMATSGAGIKRTGSY